MTTETELLSLLKSVKGVGSFETSGVKQYFPLGLQIEEIGEVGFPLSPIVIKELIKVAKQAPFGKGSQTITDTSVRKTWEIDAGKVSFKNKEWQGFLDQILEKTKKGLGIENHDISAHLYKLLIYEEGGFFLPHKDSEKEKGMFATLTIGLPSEYTGGELVVRFGGDEEIIDFSPATNNYKLPYAAFYADCEHEVKPVTAGYRVNLVYNLIQQDSSATLKGPEFLDQLEKTKEILIDLQTSVADNPRVILLDHQYTPANFSLNNLKQHDSPRAQLLIAAAEASGFFARLGLVTYYVQGNLEGVGYGDYDATDEGYMGDDIYDNHTIIEHWSEVDGPTLGKVIVDESEIITELELGEGEPLEKEAEGYTGNAGMTMEYWYHYGAVVIWHKDEHAELLFQQPTVKRLDWLAYYIDHLDNEELNAKSYAQQLLKGFANLKIDKSSYGYKPKNYNPIANALIKLNDTAFIKKEGQRLFTQIFEGIDIAHWSTLLHHFSPDLFSPIIEEIFPTEEVTLVQHLLGILQTLLNSDKQKVKKFAVHHLNQLPTYLTKIQLAKIKKSDYYFDDTIRKDKISSIIQHLLTLSKVQEGKPEWMEHIIATITKKLPRNYVNEVVHPILCQSDFQSLKLTTALKAIFQADFEKRTKKKPTPPKTWKRKVPKTTYDEKIWELLRPFLESPTQQTFDYVKNESYRKNMKYAIKRVTIDLETETIRRGRPYTLRLTKTQAAYDKKLKEWEEDVALLEQLGTGNK